MSFSRWINQVLTRLTTPAQGTCTSQPSGYTLVTKLTLSGLSRSTTLQSVMWFRTITYHLIHCVSAWIKFQHLGDLIRLFRTLLLSRNGKLINEISSHKVHLKRKFLTMLQTHIQSNKFRLKYFDLLQYVLPTYWRELSMHQQTEWQLKCKCHLVASTLDT